MKISVIVPVYNQEELVIKALDSIPKRDDIEIIVIDDGSTDNTWKNLCKYPYNLRLYKNEKNMGLAYTANVGYDVAIGEYIVLLDSDDYFITDEFIKVIDNELTGEDMIYFNLRVNNGDIWILNEDTKDLWVGETKFMKRNFIGDTRCPEEIRVNEDWYFYQDLKKKNPTEKFTNKTIKHYNFPREGSLTWDKANGITT